MLHTYWESTKATHDTTRSQNTNINDLMEVYTLFLHMREMRKTRIGKIKLLLQQGQNVTVGMMPQAIYKTSSSIIFVLHSVLSQPRFKLRPIQQSQGMQPDSHTATLKSLPLARSTEYRRFSFSNLSASRRFLNLL